MKQTGTELEPTGDLIDRYLSSIRAVTPLQMCNICSRLKLFRIQTKAIEKNLCIFGGNQRFGNLAPPAGVAEWVGFLCCGSLHHKPVYWSAGAPVPAHCARCWLSSGHVITLSFWGRVPLSLLPAAEQYSDTQTVTKQMNFLVALQ